MIRLLTTAAIAMVFWTCVAGATIRVSYDDGDWNRIFWLPGGVPQAGDTVIIATNVTGIPSGSFSAIIIKAQGSLRVDDGTPMVETLVNDGTLMIERHAVLRAGQSVRNAGAITGEGVLCMVRDGATVAGSGAFGNLAVSGGSGTEVSIETSLTVASLAIGAGNRLLAGLHALTVNGPYVSASDYGVPGIVAAGGIVTLNGVVEGSVQGDIVIGNAPGYRASRRGTLQTVHGVLGGGSVRFAASREISFSTLVGTVSIDSGVVLRAAGIGEQGWNRVEGSLKVEGELAASEDIYRWIIEGDLFNSGRIDNCTIVIQGHGGILRSDHGAWDQGINLMFLGDTGAELLVQGSITVSRLAIMPRTAADSNVVMRAGSSVVKIRHNYTSDIGKNCRIVTDTVVRIWGAASGIVEGDVLFEGFWDSPVAGRYGGAGADVRFLVPKDITGEFRASEALRSEPNGHIEVNAPAMIMGNVFLRGSLTLHKERTFTVAGDTVRLAGAVHGGGTLHLIAPHTCLDASGSFVDSTILEAGRPDAVTAITLARTLFASRITINLGSSISYHAGDSMYASRELRYALRYDADFNAASPACYPLERRGLLFFTGAQSVFRFRGQDLGYGTADSLKAGEECFVRFPAATTVWHIGKVANLPLTIPIRAGWNLIGGASIPVNVNRIEVSGTRLLTGFLNALGKPAAVSVLQPGRAYWVQAAGAGTLRYDAEP